ncbi:asparagine synthase [Schizosaccharomyces cryophilus OY26]|uniref:Asparagine synthase n=1 Tax=Schizosaccharomyces cryophilus (strain OY26 / ATCC MYA-4695 / CBS 11777 / NBRC 106824 / NRRL Y48691) TaxID=653667 RepID=S9XJL0_SCHCR|nr:asparagine synthase [Schizosaccharomyces cryophilus OY26]EPY53886.1 asparagine synthase [Schizosaccharomyces cryophilus OY26]
MCGILFALSRSEIEGLSASYVPCLRERICARGPDAFGKFKHKVEGWNLEYESSVLHLRGPCDNPTNQPHVDDHGNVLCWNGEIWQMDGEEGFDSLECCSENDGSKLFRILKENDHNIEGVLRSIQGPFAFVYYQSSTSTLWFGRDRLGRRSLLYHQDQERFVLASVSHGKNFQELPPGFYAFKLKDNHPSCLAQSLSSTFIPFQLSPLSIDVSTFSDMKNPVDTFYAQLSESLKDRVLTIPNNNSPQTESPIPRLAVLYSGGVDCGVIARMIHDIIPSAEPIDLINVAFENPRFMDTFAVADEDGCSAPLPDPYNACPDRQTGLQGWKELMTTCPNRVWNFIAVNVPYTEACKQKDLVTSLIYPNDSIMDFSIGLAFYFASKGEGILLRSPDDLQNCSTCPSYKTSAKVLFSGLGADEQLGGYMRHLRAFERKGMEGLDQELKLDIERIPHRNLGRDDRIMSNQGKEVRYPFLDERLMALLSKMPTSSKMRLDLLGGDKLILRELARKLQSPLVGQEKKRAIQFGSKAAKMESGTGRTSGKKKLQSINSEVL